MRLHEMLLKKKKYFSGLVEGVDLIFWIVCQISDQDNVGYKIRKSYWHFQIKKFCFELSIMVKCRFCCYNL